MRSPFRARGLPAETYASWRASLDRQPGAQVRILAWARGQDAFVVGSPAVLSIGGVVEPSARARSARAERTGSDRYATAADDAAGDGPEADVADHEVDGAEPEQPDEAADEQVEGDTWRHVAWHRIEHGGWNAESRSLSWTLYGGRRGRVGLAEPGRLPELFRERVSASIVVERFVPIRGERGVTVTARRDLGAGGELTWHSTLTRGLSWSTDGVAEEVARATAELRSEYGSSAAGW